MILLYLYIYSSPTLSPLPTYMIFNTIRERDSRIRPERFTAQTRIQI